MSRLIDADEFQKQIVGMAILNNYPPDKANALCKLVDSQPTAFDAKKVVEQLEESRGYIATPKYCNDMCGDSTCDGRNCFQCCLDYLINIVKRGGRDEE